MRLTTWIEDRVRAALPDAKVTALSEDDVHFDVVIVSSRFSGLSPLARHRLIHSSLGDALQDKIHAIALQTLAPDEI